MDNEVKKSVQSIMQEFIARYDEYVFCMSFATQGIREQGEKLGRESHSKQRNLWIGSDLESNQKFHAKINIQDCIEKCKEDGVFSNEIRKSLLCTMYSLWDELYRHEVAEICGVAANNLVCPLMGDLRKLRHCIIHEKSIVSEKGILFEVLGWDLPVGKLNITKDLFLDFNDAVRGKGMNIQVAQQSPEMAEIYQLMTKKERNRFDEFYKIKGNKANNVPWPDMDRVLKRIEQSKLANVDSEA